jgi:hypothetical protein
VPVEGATVFFSPASSHGDAARGLPAAGRTGAGGGFTLNAGGGATPGAGTKAGDYVVNIVKQEVDGIPASSTPSQPPDFLGTEALLPNAWKLDWVCVMR